MPAEVPEPATWPHIPGGEAPTAQEPSMDNMDTRAPERIWAGKVGLDVWWGTDDDNHFHDPTDKVPATLYIRADLHDAALSGVRLAPEDVSVWEAGREEALRETEALARASVERFARQAEAERKPGSSREPWRLAQTVCEDLAYAIYRLRSPKTPEGGEGGA